MILLDTNVLVHYLKGSPRIVERIQHSRKGDLGVPCVAMYELEHGTRRAKGAWRRARMSAVLNDLEQVPFDSAAALAAARIRLQLEMRGITIGPLDLLIAGTALSRGARLVTNNIQEFSRVPGLDVVDWNEQPTD